MVIDRLGIRNPPPGQPIMYQSWGKLLFLHWPISPHLLRPLIPKRLEIDTYNGTAWISISPFTMWDIRPAFVPAIPGLSKSHELNVRTYVHLNGIPGIWFLSLDANNRPAVLGARLFFGLPYYDAQMDLQEKGETISFSSRRRHSGAPAAEFRATWTRGEKIPDVKPETLDFFLTERYCLYTMRNRSLYQGRIHHRPWPLRSARLLSLHSTMIESHGLPKQHGKPLLHAQAEPLHVKIYALEKV